MVENVFINPIQVSSHFSLFFHLFTHVFQHTEGQGWTILIKQTNNKYQIIYAYSVSPKQKTNIQKCKKDIIYQNEKFHILSKLKEKKKNLGKEFSIVIQDGEK